MSRELSVAYARIKREWPGLVIRQHQPRTVGWPDFILVHQGMVIFTEVKWIEKPTRLEPMQASWLIKLQEHGAISMVLGCYQEGWVAWRDHFYRLATPGLLEVESGKDWWRGPHLTGLASRLALAHAQEP